MFRFKNFRLYEVVWMREWESVFVYEREMCERESVCVCVRERERERERDALTFSNAFENTWNNSSIWENEVQKQNPESTHIFER